MKKRKTWEEYFMDIVDATAERSTCDRGKPGCIFVKNNQILVTGYAGSPPGFPHCDDVGHLMERRTEFIPTEDETLEMNSWNKDEEHDGYYWNTKLLMWTKKTTEHCIRTIHAEQNAIAQAAKRGVSLEGSTCYITMTPCRTCTMLIISLGVKNVICKKLYQKAQESLDIFYKARIPVTHLQGTKHKL